MLLGEAEQLLNAAGTTAVMATADSGPASPGRAALHATVLGWERGLLVHAPDIDCLQVYACLM
eukprot:SAG31_NODE_33082_length_348_cov_0.622490_1_plen_62_part_01